MFTRLDIEDYVHCPYCGKVKFVDPQDYEGGRVTTCQKCGKKLHILSYATWTVSAYIATDEDIADEAIAMDDDDDE